ncbi:unnamed protein product, partial [Mesorhabditis spiculigera]
MLGRFRLCVTVPQMLSNPSAGTSGVSFVRRAPSYISFTVKRLNSGLPGAGAKVDLDAAALAAAMKRKRRWQGWIGGTTLLGIGLGYLGYLFTPDWRQMVDSKHYYTDWKEIPEWLRPALLGAFATTYDCQMEEAVNPDFKAYPTFAAFFNRELRPESRPISASPLVSPADGIVLHYGRVENEKIEYVKGHDYSIGQFLGKEVKLDPELDLYQVVIYLAPGNYHSFHSPARWIASESRHYPGLLLSVKPALLDRVPHLFCLNERVVLNGKWKHGFFSMSAVAATNVGDIAIDAMPDLRTNVRVRRKLATAEPALGQVRQAYKPGDKVGEFRLGSTIVLVFQGPPTLRFAIQAGDSLRYGQSLVSDGC